MAAWRRSFVSGEVTPMFDLAAGTIECYDNRWYVAAPVYSLALLDGFGRIGHDRHWFSDVIGSALPGVGTCIVIMLSITGECGSFRPRRHRAPALNPG